MKRLNDQSVFGKFVSCAFFPSNILELVKTKHTIMLFQEFFRVVFGYGVLEKENKEEKLSFPINISFKFDNYLK